MLRKLLEICLLAFFFISCSTVSVTPSMNTAESTNDFMILIISFISLFEINKVNPFPAPSAPFPLIFLLNLFIAFKAKLLTKPDKLSLAKGIATFVGAFFPKLANHEPKDPPDWIILDIWAWLSFISTDILLAKVFLILVVCLVVKNNLYGNSSSSKFFLFDLNIVIVFFAADFDLFNCVFVSLTVASW